MSDIAHAPFTPEQVAIIKAWQELPYFHPLTCSGGGGKCSNLGDEIVMIPTERGLECPQCGRIQTSVPKICLKPINKEYHSSSILGAVYDTTDSD